MYVGSRGLPFNCASSMWYKYKKQKIKTEKKKINKNIKVIF